MADGFTLEKLAQALRGMPRQAPILIKLGDGRLAEIAYVQPMYVRARDGLHEQSVASGGNTYGITLVPKIESE
jgi:hypothetical protein